MPDEHARLSPSSASRWLRCPGSVNFIDGLPDESGDAANEGTILHWIAEQCLLDPKASPYDWVDHTISLSQIAEWTGNGDGGLDKDSDFSLDITEEMADQIMDGLDRIDEIPGKIFIEKTVPLDRWMPGQFGRLDVGIVGKKRITLFDWKFGFLPVSPIENDQLRIYALGFWQEYCRDITDAEDFLLIIFQPRAPGGGGEWRVTLDELLAFGKEVKVAAARTYKTNAKRIAGEKQCLYCPGARTLNCPEYAAYNLDMVRLDFDAIDDEIEHGLPLRTPNVAGLTPAQASHLALHRASLNKFFDRVHERVRDDAIKGLRTPGVKAVEGRKSPRKWLDAEEVTGDVVEKVGRGRAFTRKLISPTAFEKLVGPEDYSEVARKHITRATAKPVLVHEDDDRPAIRSVVDEFNDDD